MPIRRCPETRSMCAMMWPSISIGAAARQILVCLPITSQLDGGGDSSFRRDPIALRSYLTMVFVSGLTASFSLTSGTTAGRCPTRLTCMSLRASIRCW